ncbi:MAG: TetR/AcrR family transcriptional regulator [Jatrophihabitans sp.]|uniref:TetR/AcrR family transcriptional regulator n=1 Tax=Jatrophihabitans sp. TaxID=1932789 RepID=UPI003F7FC25A
MSTASDVAEEVAAPTPLRRRGAALEDAIRAAAFAELTEVGYGAFSVESVAARARTGKASIYRRWPTKQELVLDAIEYGFPTAEQCGLVIDVDHATSTADALREVARAIARVMQSPVGAAMRAVKMEAFSDPDMARLVDERFQEPRREALLGLLRRGVERGEVRPEACTRLVADVLPAMIAHRVLMMREPLKAHHLEAIMDEVMIPLVQAH